MEPMERLGLLLDMGVALIRSGAETHRVEDSLYRLADAFQFKESDIWVVPSNIQATVTGEDEACLTQIRHVRGAGVDFDRLDMLNALCRAACAGTVSPEALRERLDAFRDDAPQPLLLHLLGGALAGAGFGIFFHCDASDMLAAALASLLITALSRYLRSREPNLLTFNFLIAFVTECFILLSVRLGLGHHAGAITVGVIMLLISALGTTNGVRDLVHLDTLSGLMNITASLVGAIGIVLGIALPLTLLGEQGSHAILGLAPDPAVQLAACLFACVGFALWFRVKGGKIALCALGAPLTWGCYLLASRRLGLFAATLVAAAFCGLYAQGMARLAKAPATIFSTVSVLPLIPGAGLYYAVYGVVMNDAALALGRGKELALTCFGIVIGFLVAEALTRVVWWRSRRAD